MRNIDSITAPVTAPPSDIHQLHHPMAQHAMSHFISKIIITDSAYQDGMDPKHERQSVGTFYPGFYLFIFQVHFSLNAADVEAAQADLLSKTQSLSVFCDETPFMGLERQAVTITRRCHPSHRQFVQPVWSPAPSCDSLQMNYELSMPRSLARSLELPALTTHV